MLISISKERYYKELQRSNIVSVEPEEYGIKGKFKKKLMFVFSDFFIDFEEACSIPTQDILRNKKENRSCSPSLSVSTVANFVDFVLIGQELFAFGAGRSREIKSIYNSTITKDGFTFSGDLQCTKEEGTYTYKIVNGDFSQEIKIEILNQDEVLFTKTLSSWGKIIVPKDKIEKWTHIKLSHV